MKELIAFTWSLSWLIQYKVTLGKLRLIEVISVFVVIKELTQKWFWFLKIGPMDYLTTKFQLDSLIT